MWKSVLKIREWFYQKGMFNKYRLPAFTISIGNISLGGTGKSPMAERIARHYIAKGKKVVLLSRGYARKSKEAIIIPPCQKVKKDFTAFEIGDEPAMLLQRLPELGLVIAPNRGRIALEHWALIQADIVILDDGFQHLAVERDLDLVMIDLTTKPNESLLPFGRMREPIAALSRANAVILHRANEVGAEQKTNWVQTIQNDLSIKKMPPIFTSSNKASAWIKMPIREKISPEFISGKNVLLCTGVGRPESVRHSYTHMGANILKQISLPDHAQISKKDLNQIVESGKHQPNLIFAYTEKDSARWSTDLKNLPISHGYLEMELELEDAFWRFLESSHV